MGNLLNMSGGSLLRKSLPYDAEIEYLESTGSQWIDTLVYGDLNTEAELVFTIGSASLNNGCCIFGTRKSATEKTFCSLLGKGDVRINVDIYNYTTSRAYYTPVTADTVYTIHLDRNIRSIKQNGSILGSNTIAISSPFTTERTLKIGYTDPACNWYNLTDNLIGKIYYCYIKKNGEYVRDLIPVRVGNVGYMYDKVSGQLFGNAGTGDFILGPDKTI